MTISDNTESCYSRNTSKVDKKCVHNILKLILNDGYVISVYEDSNCLLALSDSIIDIKNELASTGEDVLRIREIQEGGPSKMVGWFHLIYNNGTAALECICDYSANEYCESIYEQLEMIVE